MARRCTTCLQDVTLEAQGSCLQADFQVESLCAFSGAVHDGFDACVSQWFLSNRLRNRMMHSVCGNGGGRGKGQGKQGKGGKQDAVQKSDSLIYMEAMQDALPEAARMRAQTTLLQSEWSVNVCYHQALTAKGGVAVAPKACLPELVSRIGYTGQPCAVLITQNPDEVGLRAYPRDLISCTLVVAAANGTHEHVQAKRWLVQLGFGTHAMRRVEGEEIHIGVHMVKMVCKLSPLRGWAIGPHPSSVLMSQITAHIVEAAVEHVVSREDGSFTFYCHASSVDKVLQASGQQGVYYKVHQDESISQTFDLLWLPEEYSPDDGSRLCSDSRVFGMVEKGKNGRLALRFRDSDSMSAFAREKGLDDVSALGRWKVSGVPVSAGLHGLVEMLLAKSWKVEQVVYLDDTHAIFLSASRGLDGPLYFKHGAQAHQIRFKALNAKARELSKDDAMSSRASTSGVFPQRLNRDTARTSFLRTVMPAPKALAFRTGSQDRQKRAGGKSGETPEPKANKKDDQDL